MPKEPLLLTFSIGQPYEAGLKLVRKALDQQGLRTAAELNVSARIKHELGAGLAPCAVLYVDDPVLLLEAVIFDRGAASLIPQPVVVSGTNQHTEVLVRGVDSIGSEAVPAAVREPLRALQIRIARAIETVGEREGAHLIGTA